MTTDGKRELDGTWRLVARRVVERMHPLVDGHDCYVFRRRGDERYPAETYVIRVDRFWAAKGSVVEL